MHRKCGRALKRCIQRGNTLWYYYMLCTLPIRVSLLKRLKFALEIAFIKLCTSSATTETPPNTQMPSCRPSSKRAYKTGMCTFSVQCQRMTHTGAIVCALRRIVSCRVACVCVCVWCGVSQSTLPCRFEHSRAHVHMDIMLDVDARRTGVLGEGNVGTADGSEYEQKFCPKHCIGVFLCLVFSAENQLEHILLYTYTIYRSRPTVRV